MRKKIVFLLSSLLLVPLHVYAAGTASLKVASTVEVDSRVTATVTLKNVAAWNIRIISSGSTSGCTQSFADASSNGKNTTKTLSVTCKATSIGAIGFTVTGDITSADGSTTDVSLNKRVTVTKAREKSADANLSSLTLTGYELTPLFNKDTLEYNVTVPSTVDKVAIDAKVNESHATVAGIGEFEVTEGTNTFKVIVTAETGVTKTYVIQVNVEDTNPIKVNIKDKEYQIVKNAKNLSIPDGYDETTVQISGFSIPAFHSETTNFTLVGVKDENGKTQLAIYKEENEYVLYNEHTAESVVLYLVNFPEEIKDYTKTTIMINDIEIPAYQQKENSRFVIVYGMNVLNGEYNQYKYDTVEHTFQIWEHEEVDELKETLQTYLYILIAFGAGLFFSLILILCLLMNRGKRKKKKNALEKEQKTKEKIEEKTKEEVVKEKEDSKEEPKEENKIIEDKMEDKEDADVFDLFEDIKQKKKERD